MSNVIADDFSVNDAAPDATAVPLEVTFTANTPPILTAFSITDGANVTDGEPGRWIQASIAQLNKLIEDLAAVRVSFSE